MGMSFMSMKLPPRLRKLFYKSYNTVAEWDHFGPGGKCIRPSVTYELPRFKWVGPIQGWKDSELDRQLTGRFRWRWGLLLINGIVYSSLWHHAKWASRRIWCEIRYRGHDYGGPIGSCSRCGSC